MEFINANEHQKAAIMSTEGPLLIIAGPGTGKTFTLINRTLNLIVNKNVDPCRILLTTFTEKAAHEMISRLSTALYEQKKDFNPNEMYIGTFHSICLKIIKDNVAFSSLKKNFRLMDSFDQQYFIYRNYRKFKEINGFESFYDKGTVWDRCADLMSDINKLTEEMIDFENLLASANAIHQFFGKVLQLYANLRIENNLLDFSSIQVEAYQMLQSNEELRKKIIDSIDYVMIDEYQDTNHIQEKLAFLFGSKHNNICVVGDDDQSIYRFRGATVRNILEFPNHFPNCTRVELTENYRSEKDIINFYNNWMETTSGRDFEFKWGKYRFPKRIVPAKKNLIDSDTTIQLSTKEEDYINEKVLGFIHSLVDSGKISDYNQIAFLFRSVKSIQAVDLANFLEKSGIPVYSPRSNMFFERPEIKRLLGVLLLLSPAFLRKMKSFKTDSQIALAKYYQSCLQQAESILSDFKNEELLKWTRFRVRELILLEGSGKTMDYGFSELMYQMLEFSPFREMMDVDLNKKLIDSRTNRNIALFIKLIIKFEFLNGIIVLSSKNVSIATDRLFGEFFRFLKEGGISEYEDENEYAPSGCISFLTIHQSKGLEFPVLIVGSQSATPRKDYDENIEEIVSSFSDRGRFESLDDIKYFDFWRLFYVAFSRAKNLLVLLCDKSKSSQPSKYFEWYYDKLPFDTDLAKFAFDDVRVSKLKNSYSFTSDINVYLTCPFQYKYFKVLGFQPVRNSQTIFGTLVHETIEDIHRSVLRNEVDQVNPDNIKKWLDINYQTISKKENSYLAPRILASALNQVLNYYNVAKEDWSIIKNAEMPISLSQDKYIITGKVDLILDKNGNYQILDFKTEEKPDVNRDIEKVTRVRRQLEIYAYLLEQRYGVKVNSMKAYYTGTKDESPTITFTRDESHIQDTINTFSAVVDKIEENDFGAKCCDLRMCKNCDLRFFCKRGK